MAKNMSIKNEHKQHEGHDSLLITLLIEVQRIKQSYNRNRQCGIGVPLNHNYTTENGDMEPLAQMTVWHFIFLTVFKSYYDEEGVIMKGSVQRSAIQSFGEICL